MKKYVIRELQIDAEDRADVEDENKETAESAKEGGPSSEIHQKPHRAEDEVYEKIPVIAHLCKTEEERAQEELRAEDKVHLRYQILRKVMTPAHQVQCFFRMLRMIDRDEHECDDKKHDRQADDVRMQV